MELIQVDQLILQEVELSGVKKRKKTSLTGFPTKLEEKSFAGQNLL